MVINTLQYDARYTQLQITNSCLDFEVSYIYLQLRIARYQLRTTVSTVNTSVTTALRGTIAVQFRSVLNVPYQTVQRRVDSV